MHIDLPRNPCPVPTRNIASSVNNATPSDGCTDAQMADFREIFLTLGNVERHLLVAAVTAQD
jgi:hypothetical protein